MTAAQARAIERYTVSSAYSGKVYGAPGMNLGDALAWADGYSGDLSAARCSREILSALAVGESWRSHAPYAIGIRITRIAPIQTQP